MASTDSTAEIKREESFLLKFAENRAPEWIIGTVESTRSFVRAFWEWKISIKMLDLIGLRLLKRLVINAFVQNVNTTISDNH